MKKILLFLLPLLSIIYAKAQQITLDNNLVIELRDYSYWDGEEYIENKEVGVVDGKNCIGDIEIPATVTIEGTEYPVEYIFDGAFSGNYNLTSIVGCENIKFIGNIVVFNCSHLVSVCDMPKLEALDSGAFQSSGIRIVGSIPKIKDLGECVFWGCANLQSVGIDKIRTIGRECFYGCGNLPTIGDLSELVSVSDGSLDGCSSLVGEIDLSKLTSIGASSFEYCYKLTFTGGDSYPFDYLPSNAFADCSGLEDINLSNVTMIGEGALQSTSITSVDLSNITSLPSYVFKGCKNLDAVDLSLIRTIGSEAFNETNATLTFTTYEPCQIDQSFCANNTIIVPKDALQTYRDAWTDYQWQIIGDDHSKVDHEVTVVADENDSDLRNKLYAAGIYRDFSDVRKLKVSGTINGWDMMILRNKMINLQELDLSDAVIVELPDYEYYTGYHSTDNVIGPCWFREIKNLRKIVLPNSATEIGEFAFYECGLEEVVFGENLERIGESAFASCWKLNTLEFPEKLREIGYQAFDYCSGLKKIKFPENLNCIQPQAFMNCNSLEALNLPTMLRAIGDGAFQYCYELREITIPAAVQHIGDYAFMGASKIRTVKTKTVMPTNINQNTFDREIYDKTDLKYPLQGERYYYWGTQWSQFVKQDTFDEAYKYFYIPSDEDMTLKEDERFNSDDETKPDVDVLENSGLVVEGEIQQELGELSMDQTGSIIGQGEGENANISVEKMTIQIDIEGNRWYFFSFPFDIDYHNIKFNGKFVWRYYDGEERAQTGAGAWKNQDGELKAGVGYIFQANKSGKLELTIENVKIGGDDKVIALQGYNSDYPENADWNLIGNPFTSYYNVGDLGTTTPITIWDQDNNTYRALSPEDDDYYLYPYQAFFIQSSTTINLDSEYRTTQAEISKAENRQNARARRAARRAPSQFNRYLINIELVNGERTDNTRVVFNEGSSEDYESVCDASKFLNADVAQIYTLGSRNTRYAINERPEMDGIVRLGFSTPQSGVFTIRATRTDCPMSIRDLATGETAALNSEGYTFTCDAGVFDGRFILVMGEPSGVVDISRDDEDAIYYGVNGITYGSNINNAAPGVVIVRDSNGSTSKVVNK